MLCLGVFAIDSGIAFNNAAALDGNLITSEILDGSGIVQVPNHQPDPTPLLIAVIAPILQIGDPDSSAIRRLAYWQQFEVSPPQNW